MEAIKLRKLFLDYFKVKAHQVVGSAPMVAHNDPTLMFINAGMNPFKDIFLGDSTIKDKRVANSQKCLRVSGKHNDLEEVGHDTYHHTMFEMLGNWSFGDYFKKEAIQWSWEFLTEVCKLDKDRLYVTIFEGAKDEQLAEDEESDKIWSKFIDSDRILNGSKKDNFWEMGETGPCGPCSEIHYDNRDEQERAKVDGATLVNKDHPQVIEIWNLVFMQFSRKADGNLVKLPKKHVDTGMGFERLCMIMQNKKSNYDTDIFQPLIQAIAKYASVEYGKNDKTDVAIRVIADHIRAITFSIADGQLPSNVKAGYVIRRILRRAVRYGYSFLDIKEPFMYQLVDVLDGQMSKQFPEIHSQIGIIKNVIKEEEQSFLRTLEAGLKRIQQLTAEGKNISGKQLFELYDTFGFPKDLSILILNEKGMSCDTDGFDTEMQKQKDRSKTAAKITTSDWQVLIEDEVEEFVGYKKLEIDVKITRYRVVKTTENTTYQLVFNLTPFYAEGGGQVGDKGIIQNEEESIEISDTKKENNVTIHFTDKLPSNLKAVFLAQVNTEERISIARNHTATHLLHESLQQLLGEHVQQKGSLVCADYLRFDFSHFSKLSKHEINQIEAEVNAKVLQNITLKEHNNKPLSEAKKEGAMMLFGEKYADVVRMIQFGSSKELCGGTHVNATGKIGLFKITSESSIASGIRRVEAITGTKALAHFNNQDDLVEEISRLLKTKDLVQSISNLISSNKKQEKELQKLKLTQLDAFAEELFAKSEKVNKVNVIAEKVDLDATSMKNIAFKLKQKENLLLVLGAESQGKAIISIMLTDDLVQKNKLSAKILVSEISPLIQGGGGGQAHFATAGGSNPKGLQKALEKIKQIIV
ncbi:MAG: alanine--tRNA ligase [Flavobacteriales bacterium TMED123]|nr:MAG: alanine--tRNA ligase [Flavobacteriales bacterium TMED123]